MFARPQADAGELADQVGLLGGQARAAEHGERVRAVLLPGCARSRRATAVERLVVRQRPEAARRGRVASQRRRAAGRGARPAGSASRPSGRACPVERKLLPRLEADDLVVLHLELDAALLAAEAAVRLHQPVGLDAGSQPRAASWSTVRAEPVDDREFARRAVVAIVRRILSASGHWPTRSVDRQRSAVPQAPCARPKQRSPAARADPLVVPAVGRASRSGSRARARPRSGRRRASREANGSPQRRAAAPARRVAPASL